MIVIISIFSIIGFILIFITFYKREPIFLGTWKEESSFGQYIGGLIGTVFIITSTLLIILTFIKQSIDNKKNQIERHFFKMLDYHNDNVNNLSIKHIKLNEKEKVLGRRAFVIFRLQLFKLLEIVEKIDEELKLKLKKKQIIDLAYITFFYGIDKEWKDFLIRKLIRYERSNEIVDLLIKYKEEEKNENNKNIGRTNQTSLSSYFRNMYNAIKYIDESRLLTFDEKSRLIKIFRAQLSNPELFVLYLNVVSRFGKNWIKNNYIIKYEFIKNIPRDYCGKYDHTKKFKMQYEEDELLIIKNI